ncbi:leukocyte receptor cluster member 1 [Brienomyrus brachyistius]|uniref:leukocyte receptor cluster member 1 n=1 Tax=Brienomyrus brachyistius TaxID=42636 RepID=UPI0020B1FA18|nr:leukocyte receptor cluster member 1 [Brienomyrus brachyistius]
MNILPKKSWHVRNKDNIARVRRDEAKAAEEEREVRRRIERAEQEARTDYLRRKSRAALSKGEELKAVGGTPELDGEEEHLNLFPVEEAGQKKGNEEYLREKKEEKERQERAIGLLVSLGPAPGTEATPWYLKDGGSKSKEVADKSVGWTEEEKRKKDKRLKDTLDPLKEMKKGLAVKDKKEKKEKSKRKEKAERAEKTSGESSMDRLRAERLQREADERQRSQALLEQKSGRGGEAQGQRELQERDRPYNSAYFPELARKRQRRENYSGHL